MSSQEAIKTWSYEKNNALACAFSRGEADDIQGICQRRIINMNLNAGIFNPDYRNEEIKQYILNHARKYTALQHYSLAKMENKLCNAILAVSPATMKYVFFDKNSRESMATALKFGKFATKRERVIHIGKRMDFDAHTNVEYNNLDQLEAALKGNDVAGVLVESIPAAKGFPPPKADYLKQVGELAHQYGALYIADETYTGLMRSGEMWCAVGDGAEPDMIVTGKDIAGGNYPLSALIMNEDAGAMQKEEGFDHLIFFDHAKLGCAVATQVLEIINKPSTKENIAMLAASFKRGVAEIKDSHPVFFKSFRQRGLLMSLEIASAKGAAALRECLYENGIATTGASFDPTIVQFKAGLLMEEDLAEEVLNVLDLSLAQTAERFGFY